jgi:hypothetical protein
MLTLGLILLLMKMRKWRMQRELKWQLYLLSKGVGFRTKVEDIVKAGSSVNGYKKICFRAVLRVNGKTVCKKMQTLVRAENVLHPGDKVLIRYLPGKMDHVMISNPAA